MVGGSATLLGMDVFGKLSLRQGLILLLGLAVRDAVSFHSSIVGTSWDGALVDIGMGLNDGTTPRVAHK